VYSNSTRTRLHIFGLGLGPGLGCKGLSLTVAPLRSVSPGAPTDGVTYFFHEIALLSPTISTFRRRLSSVLSKFSHRNNFILVGCHPLDGITPGGPLPLSPSDAIADSGP